jgi:hypothetical protein
VLRIFDRQFQDFLAFASLQRPKTGKAGADETRLFRVHKALHIAWFCEHLLELLGTNKVNCYVGALNGNRFLDV